MRVVRWGIIGCGEVTEVKSGPGFQKAEGSALQAVMRRNAALAEDYASRHGVPAWYSDADALIADPDVDAIYIATPPSSHADYVTRCAREGKPVLVEKPMARSFAEAQTMMDVCREAGVPLFVAYYRRALPRYLKIKALLEAGAIGAVRAVEIRLLRPPLPADLDTSQVWRVDPAVGGGGHFFDMAGHQLDFLDFLFGPIVDALGHAANQAGLYAAEDIVSGHFRFASGIEGTGLWCYSSAERRDEITLYGTVGTLRFSVFDDEPITLEAGGNVQKHDIRNPPHVHQPLIQQVVDHLRGVKMLDECAGENGVRTARVMDGMLGRI